MKIEKKHRNYRCSVMQPGPYDIETEMCTPEIDDVKDYIPPEIQANILDKKPVSCLSSLSKQPLQISMFITVYLMDMEPRSSKESYLSAFGKAILQRRLVGILQAFTETFRMAQSTVACFLLGIDVKLALPNLN